MRSDTRHQPATAPLTAAQGMSTGEPLPRAPLAQPIRSLLGIVDLLVKAGVMPDIDSLLAKPHDDRLATTVPGLMFRRPNPAIQTVDVLVDGRGGPIPVRIYSRPDVRPGAPGYLFIHGGGFADGGVAHCDHVCRELADRSGFVVVGLSYRLAPQHPFPAGLEDCQDVLTWMARTRPAGLDPDRLAVAGESAGGNLTTALALCARDNGGPCIAHQAPIYPLTDFTFSHIDWSEPIKGNPGVNPKVAEAMRSGYLPDGNYEEPLASVHFADHAGLPPALVVTCGHDILRNEGVALARSFAAAGVVTNHAHLPDMPHGYLLMTRLTRRAYETMDLMIAEARRHL